MLLSWRRSHWDDSFIVPHLESLTARFANQTYGLVADIEILTRLCMSLQASLFSSFCPSKHLYSSRVVASSLCVTRLGLSFQASLFWMHTHWRNTVSFSLYFPASADSLFAVSWPFKRRIILVKSAWLSSPHENRRLGEDWGRQDCGLDVFE